MQKLKDHLELRMEEWYIKENENVMTLFTPKYIEGDTARVYSYAYWKEYNEIFMAERVISSDSLSSDIKKVDKNQKKKFLAYVLKSNEIIKV